MSDERAVGCWFPIALSLAMWAIILLIARAVVRRLL